MRCREGVRMLDYIDHLISFQENIDCHFVRCGRFRAAVRPKHYKAMARDMDDLRQIAGVESFTWCRARRQHTEIEVRCVLRRLRAAETPMPRCIRGFIIQASRSEIEEAAGGLGVVSNAPALSIASDGSAGFTVKTPLSGPRTGMSSLQRIATPMGWCRSSGDSHRSCGLRASIATGEISEAVFAALRCRKAACMEIPTASFITSARRLVSGA